MPEHLEGYGITLRRWRAADADLMHQAVVESTEHLRPWMPWIKQEPQTVAQRRALILRWEEEWLAGGDAAYAVFLEQALAGGCGFHHRIGPGKLEIGYWTHPDFLRRGVATAAARLLTDTAFTVPGIQHVEIHHDRANVASGGVPPRLGYELVGERPGRLEKAPSETGVDCIWRVSREAWPNAAERPDSAGQ